MKSDNPTPLIHQIRKQAAEGDPICAECLSISALNSRAGGGFSWIDTQLDTEDADEDSDDFRPF